MEIPIDSYVAWGISALYFAGALLMQHKLRGDTKTLLYPINVYVFGIGFAMLFMGLLMATGQIAFGLLTAVSILVGASTIAKYPLQFTYPKMVDKLYKGLLLIVAVLTLYLLVTKDVMLMMKVANFYAFWLAGVLTIGFIVWTGMNNAKLREESFSTAGSLGMCCTISHGIGAFGLVPTLALSVLGVFNINMQMLFAALAAISYLFVVATGKVINPVSLLMHSKANASSSARRTARKSSSGKKRRR